MRNDVRGFHVTHLGTCRLSALVAVATIPTPPSSILLPPPSTSSSSPTLLTMSGQNNDQQRESPSYRPASPSCALSLPLPVVDGTR